MSEHETPDPTSDVKRVLTWARRQQPGGSEERRLYECAEAIVGSILSDEVAAREAEAPPPVRRFPLRLVR